MKRIIFSFLCVSTLALSLLNLSACSNNNKTNLGSSDNNTSSSSTDSYKKSNQAVGFQLEKPQLGEEIAVMTTSKGTIKIRFFPDEAPKTVENFKGLANQGYYDNLTFHRVIENFMIQGGDPNGDGTGGESIWGEPFNDEFSDKIFNITGAVAMANSGPNTNGSQFFINQNQPEEFIGWDIIENFYGENIDFELISEETKELYNTNGGNPSLDGYCSLQAKGHTVFGQVIEGMDVVNAIAAVETNALDIPLEDVVIQSVKIVNYEG